MVVVGAIGGSVSGRVMGQRLGVSRRPQWQIVPGELRQGGKGIRSQWGVNRRAVGGVGRAGGSGGLGGSQGGGIQRPTGCALQYKIRQHIAAI